MPAPPDGPAATGPSPTYDPSFFDSVERSAGASAGEFVARLELGFPVRSVLDVGCGRGTWLLAWGARGVPQVFGVDGPHVDQETLLVPPEAFSHRDVGSPFDLGRTFDLVTCLEVAEHLPEERSQVLLENLARHGHRVLFSAATPGQGGYHHVNERPLEYWADRFLALGYRCLDAVRPQLRGARRIDPWYRYNTLLFVREGALDGLPGDLRSTERQSGQALRSFESPAWRARRAILRALPGGLVRALARLRYEVRARQGQARPGSASGPPSTGRGAGCPPRT